MANAVGMIDEGLWRKDKDFQRLPRLAQCTFCQVLSPKDLDTAGILTLHIDLLAKGCDELTVEQLRADFEVLEQHRFVFVDYETDEILVRSYVRRVSANSPRNRAWLSVPKNARMLASPKLRHVLAVELRRVRWKDAIELADEIDPLPTPSEPPPDPLGTPSEIGRGSEGGRDPHSQVLDKSRSPLVVNHFGERRPECPDHEENSFGKCRPCMIRRQWDEDNASLLEADELEARRQERERRDNCPRCGGTNWIPDTEPAVRCHPHLEAVNA